MTTTHSSPHESRFDRFPGLPAEIRLKIWRLACPARVVEVQLHEPSAGGHAMSEGVDVDLRPLARPTLPMILHVCRESRDEALLIYRPCAGRTFASPHPFPYNLYRPALDTLLIPISLHMTQAYRLQDLPSPAPAFSLGVPRDFILDRLAADPADVAAIRSLAISWADMHVKDVSTLVDALRPFVALRELSLVFFERRGDHQDIRLLSLKRGLLSAVLVDHSESAVRGRYLERVLEEFKELADTLNATLLEVDSAREPMGDRGRKILPVVKVRMVRFESQVPIST